MVLIWRHALHGTLRRFPMALCELEVEVNENDQIESIRAINDRWDILPELPPLRVLRSAKLRSFS